MNEMKTKSETDKSKDAEAIAEMADRGEDISMFFTNSGRMMPAHRLVLQLYPENHEKA